MKDLRVLPQSLRGVDHPVDPGAVSGSSNCAAGPHLGLRFKQGADAGRHAEIERVGGTALEEAGEDVVVQRSVRVLGPGEGPADPLGQGAEGAAVGPGGLRDVDVGPVVNPAFSTRSDPTSSCSSVPRTARSRPSVRSVRSQSRSQSGNDPWRNQGSRTSRNRTVASSRVRPSAAARTRPSSDVRSHTHSVDGAGGQPS